MSTDQRQTQKTVAQLANLVANGQAFDDLASEEETLALFEKYECWTPYFKIIQTKLQNHSASPDDYINLARVQNLFLEDIFSCAKTCSLAVSNLNLSYDLVRDTFLLPILEEGDFASEATILQAINDEFSQLDDQIACLERLCLLFEKKVFSENELGKAYAKLLQIHPKNIKALRYFKVAYAQNFEWEKVVDVLQRLIENSVHAQDVFRVAQELAAVFLYQLDRPAEALKTIAKYCTASPLDSSTIEFDAYQRMGDWEGCLEVLQNCLDSTLEKGGRAILLFKMGGLEEKIGNTAEAEMLFEKAAELWPRFLEPYEHLVEIAVAEHDWKKVQSRLTTLSDRVEKEELKNRISDAKNRLNSCVQNAKSV